MRPFGSWVWIRLQVPIPSSPLLYAFILELSPEVAAGPSGAVLKAAQAAGSRVVVARSGVQRPVGQDPPEIGAVLAEHLRRLYDFYGEQQGPRIARKHLGWYLRRVPGGEALWQAINRVESAELQLTLVRSHFAPCPGALAA